MEKNLCTTFQSLNRPNSKRDKSFWSDQVTSTETDGKGEVSAHICVMITHGFFLNTHWRVSELSF